ncbi:MAG: WG repeat-containing protein [Bacteroidetes bacterium]|nr:WG repeat-containing protein [Bacteroidota bacterium]
MLKALFTVILIGLLSQFPISANAQVTVQKQMNYELGRWEYRLIDTAKNNEPLSDWYRQLYAYRDSNKFIVQKGEKYGLISKKGKVLVPAEYDNLDGYLPTILRAQKDGYWGLISANNEVLAPFDYYLISWYNTKVFIAKYRLGSNLGLEGLNGKRILTYNYLEIRYRDSFVWAKFHNGLWARHSIDASGNVIGEITGYRFQDIQEQRFVNATIVNEFGKYGVIDSTGKLALPCRFEHIYEFSKYGSTCFMKMGQNSPQYGVISLNGDTIVPPIYAERISTSFPLLMVRIRQNMGNTGFYNQQGKMLIEPKFDVILQKHFLLVRGGVGMGAITLYGDTVVPFKYASINELPNNLLLLRNENFYVAPLHKADSILDTFQYVRTEGWGDFYLVQKAGKVGLVDAFFNWKLKPQFNEIKPLNNYGFMEYEMDGKWGLLDESAQLVANSYGFDQISYLNKHQFIVRQGRKDQLVNSQFKPIFSEQYTRMWPFKNNHLLVKKGAFFGVIDTTNQVKLAIRYSRVIQGNKYILAKRLGRVHLFDFNFKPITETRYKKVYNFHDTALIAKKMGKWVILNRNGIEISPHFKAIRALNDSVYEMGKKHKKYLANKNYQALTEAKYSQIVAMKNGKFKVKIDDKWGVLDNNYQTLIPCKFHHLHYQEQGFIHAILNDKHGIISPSGTELQPCEFDAVYLSEKHAWVVKGNQFGFCDSTGALVTPIKYHGGGGFKGGIITNGVELEDGSKLFGAINKNGVEVVPFKYAKMQWENNQLHCQNAETYDVYNDQGEFLYTK